MEPNRPWYALRVSSWLVGLAVAIAFVLIYRDQPGSPVSISAGAIVFGMCCAATHELQTRLFERVKRAHRRTTERAPRYRDGTSAPEPTSPVLPKK